MKIRMTEEHGMSGGDIERVEGVNTSGERCAVSAAEQAPAGPVMPAPQPIRNMGKEWPHEEDDVVQKAVAELRTLETVTGGLPVSESRVAALLADRSPRVVEAVTYLGFIRGAVTMDDSPAFALWQLREAIDALPDTEQPSSFESALRRMVPVEIDQKTVRLLFEFARGIRDGVAPIGSYVEVVCDACSTSRCRHQVKAALACESFVCHICGGENLCLMVNAHDDDVFDEVDASTFGTLKFISR